MKSAERDRDDLTRTPTPEFLTLSDAAREDAEKLLLKPQQLQYVPEQVNHAQPQHDTPFTHVTSTPSIPTTAPNEEKALEEQLRESNARLYQSSVSLKPEFSASIPAKAANAIELEASAPATVDVTNKATPNSALERQVKGIALTRSMIASHFPAASLDTITHLDLSLESLNQVFVCKFVIRNSNM